MIVADDHTLVRQGLVSLLEDEEDMVIVGEAGTGRQAVDLVLRERPDIALLDITMPDLTGLEAAAEISRKAPGTQVMMLTIHEEEAFFFEALQAGAAGYVLKGARRDELLTAIRSALDGGVYLPPRLAGSLVQEYLQHHQPPVLDDPLTPREREVMTLIAQGYTNRMIAEKLTLSLNTIKSHRLRIYQKLNLSDRAELVAYAVQRGLIKRGPLQ